MAEHRRVSKAGRPPAVDGTRRVLLVLFLLSGVSALAYQVVWARMLGLVFGVSVLAIATVVTAFMAGLALGSLLFGRWIDRHGDPLVVFACLQLCIALFAVAFPSLLGLVTRAYLALHQQFPTGYYLKSLVRFALVFSLLLIPTTMMGGTLPVLTKYFVTALRNAGRDLSRLYAANNLGAVLGVFLAGFVLIRGVGVQATLWLAAALNIAVALATLVVRRRASAAPGVPQAEPALPDGPAAQHQDAPPRYPAHVRTVVLWAFGIEGFCALAYEVLWTRELTGLSEHKDVYLFSTVLMSFILGLSLGSYLIGRFVDRGRDLLAAFCAVEIAIGVIAVGLLYVFRFLPAGLHDLYMWSQSSWWSGPLENAVILVVLLVPTTLMGTTFPLVGRIYTDSVAKVGRRVGTIGCLDTVGSIFGSFAGGFVLLPLVGVSRAVAVTACLNVAIGMALLASHPALRRSRRLVVAGLAIPVVAALFVLAPASVRSDIWLLGRQYTSYLYYKEGVDATVAVPVAPDGERGLMIDGMMTAFANYEDLRVHAMLGYVPLLAHPNPKRSLVIGFGMGVTSHSLTQPDMERVDCAELSPEVLEAAPSFADVNHGVRQMTGFHAIVDDGRSYLLATTESYDIITSNAIHARLSNALYTKDFYDICRSRLRAGGVMCQWLPTNWMTDTEYRMLVRSFLAAFPHTSLWEVNVGHAVLLGTPERLQVQYESFARRIAEPKAQQDLRQWDLADPIAFLAQFVADETQLRQYVEGIPLNTDDRPRVEFSFVADRGPIASVAESHILMRKRAGTAHVAFAGTDEEKGELREELARRMDAYNYVLYGDLCRQVFEDYDKALAAMQEARRLAPQDGRAATILYVELGRRIAEAGELRQAGELRRAAEVCQSVLRADPGSPSALAELALIHEAAGRLDLATRLAREAVRVDPGFARGHAILGALLMQSGAYQEAVPHLEEAIRIGAPDPMPHYYLALIHRRQGRLGDAEAELRQALHVAPDEPQVRLELASLLEQMGRPQEAAQLR